MRFYIKLVFYCLLPLPALAEYRVFTLYITDKTTKATKQINTTLDPEQYIDFYPLKKSEEISYLRTWRCAGRTDFFKSHCKNPHLPDQEPELVTSQSPEILK